MKRILLIVCALSFASAAQADLAIVKGELTFDSVGIGQVTECGTRRAVEFGAMASSPYSQLRKRYEELSSDGKAILVEVEGRFSASSTGTLVLNEPRVLGLKAGMCGNG
jgi:hypothetical protein